MLKDELKAEMTAAHVDELQAGSHKITWKEVFSNRLDSKALKSQLPDIYNKFFKVNITRRFVIA